MRLVRLVSSLFLAVSATAVLAAPAVSAAHRGTPRLNLADGHPIAVRVLGAPGAAELLASGQAHGIALAEVDLDRDGRTELVAAHSAGASGIVTVLRRDQGTLDVTTLPAPVDRMVVGDFDRDGFVDVATAAIGADGIDLLANDGRGGFGLPRRVRLGGTITALAAGEVGQPDGAVELVAGISTGRGTAVHVDALAAEPRIFAVAGEVHALAIGRFDGDGLFDVAVAEGGRLSIVSGGATLGGSVELGSGTVALAAGRFGAGAHQDVAALGADGVLRVVATTPAPFVAREVAVGPATHVAAGQVAAGRGEQVLVAGANALRVVVDTDVFVLGVAGRAGAVLPVRAEGEALAAIAVLVAGQVSPVLAPAAPLSSFTVTATGDTADATPGDGLCDNGAGACTLRAAIQEANASAGLDSIDFALGAGTPSITVTSALPAITEAVRIAGDTGGSTRVELNGNSIAAPPIHLATGSDGSTIRGLVINRAGTSQPGMKIESANNVVEACYVGPDLNGGSTVSRNSGGGIVITGAAAAGNTIGGTTAAVRNVISNNAQNGVKIDAGAAGNRVVGNHIGVNPAGDAGLSNSADGVNVAGAAVNNVIGEPTATPGTAPGNVVSGNSSDGIEITGTGTSGNTVAGNLIGLRLNGTSTQANTAQGVLIAAGASSNTVGGATATQRNVVGGNFSDGVEVTGAGTNDNIVRGNYLGVTINGDAAVANSTGVYVWGGAQRTTVGGETATPGTAPGNVISGNTNEGVKVESGSTSATTILGNIVGLNAAGAASMKNGGNGISVLTSVGTTIGGATAGSRNVISGHNGSSFNGIEIRNSGANNTTIQGNYIGTDVTGTVAIGNYNGIKANITSGTSVGGTVVGGNTATPGTAPGNLISGNQNNGITFSGASFGPATIAGNIVGLNSAGTAALKNTANGIEITSAAHDVTIGGTTAAARNVISGNGGTFNSGVSLSSTNTRNNVVQGNYIGTDITGTVALGNGQHGVVVKGGAPNNTIGGLTSVPGTAPGNVIAGQTLATGTSASCGIQVDGSGTNNTLIQGNLIGTGAAGTAALPNRRAGIYLSNSSSATTVGGAATGARNVISGHDLGGAGVGIEILQSSNNVVRGNFVGVDVTGNVALANAGDGVLITDNAQFTAASGNTIGGAAAGEGNVIAGNGGHGVRISGGFATSNTVAGNLVGVGADGATALGNGANGVYLVTGTAQNTIGGTTGLTAGACTGSCNTIVNNAGAGVRADGTGLRNAIRGNSIVANGGLGIDLGTVGVTPNDALDPDTGANNLINFPVVTGAIWDGVGTTVTGTVNTTANATGLAIELFASAAADPSGNGEGARWLGTATGIATDAAGNGTWQVVVAGQPHFLAATTVDSLGNASEYSATFDPVYSHDSDGDGVDDPLDCAPNDDTAWAIPAEVAGLGLADTDTLAWTSLAAQAGPGTTYDVLRGDASQFPVGTGAAEACLAPSLAATTTDDPSPAAPGSAFYYLVRGRNVCGTGSYGNASDGTPRTTTACP